VRQPAPLLDPYVGSNPVPALTTMNASERFTLRLGSLRFTAEDKYSSEQIGIDKPPAHILMIQHLSRLRPGVIRAAKTLVMTVRVNNTRIMNIGALI